MIRLGMKRRRNVKQSKRSKPNVIRMLTTMMKQRIHKTMKKSPFRVILTVSATDGDFVLKGKTRKEKVSASGAKDTQEKT